MKRFTLLILVCLGFLLAACAPAATQTQPPAAPVSTIAPAPADQTATKDAPAQPGAASPGAPVTGDDIRIYTITGDKTTVHYEVDEVFFSENNRLNTAIGVTNAVSGDVQLNFTDPQKSTLGEITADISTLKSDSNRRDNAIRDRWLESARFPIVKFVTTSVEGLPADYAMGTQINFKVNGDMTIRDTTRPVTFDVSAVLDGDTLTGTATTQILMTDFGFQPPGYCRDVEGEQ